MRAPFKIVCEVIKYNELVEKDLLESQFENGENLKQSVLVSKDKEEDIVIEDLDINEVKSQEEDADEWENVTYADVDLDGMKDPYKNKFANTIKDYRALSEYADKYESWTLKSLIVKSNDDIR